MTVLRILDFETTGMEPPAQVCEAAYCDLTLAEGGSNVIGEPVSWLCGVDAMPPEVRAVHWISAADVAGQAPFDRSRLFEGSPIPACLVAHNAEFEAKFLGEHGLPVICTLKAAYRVWPDAPGHSNSVLRCWLEDQGLIVLDPEKAQPTHRAGPDAYVTAHVLAALFAAGATGKEMVQWSREPRLLPTCPLGKFRGQKWPNVEAGFLTWMLNQASMEEDLKWNARRELQRRLEAKAA